MADENTEDQHDTTPQAAGDPPAEEQTQTPPWERDGEEFSPEKAWNLIQHLRADNLKLRTANESSNAKLREFENAKLSEQERLQRDLKETREQLASVNAARAWAEARAKYPQMTDEDFDLIGAGFYNNVCVYEQYAGACARAPNDDGHLGVSGLLCIAHRAACIAVPDSRHLPVWRRIVPFRRSAIPIR